MEKVYVIMQHTGSYSDYRCHPMFFTTDEETAKTFCEKAQETARFLEKKLEEIREKYTKPPLGLDWEAYDRAVKRLKSPFDENLSQYEFGDVMYDYAELSKWSQQ